MSLPGGSNAPLGLVPGNERANWMNAISGLTPFASLEKSVLGTAYWKTYRALPLLDISDEFSGTWPKKGMILRGILYRQEMSGHPISGKDSGLWPTHGASANENRTKTATPSQKKGKHGKYLAVEVLESARPTPTVNGNYNRVGASPTSGNGLATAVRLKGSAWPTPTQRDYKDTGDSIANGNVPVNGLLGRAVGPTKMNGSLDPQFVEYLQGFPTDWTVSRDWATLKSHSVLPTHFSNWLRMNRDALKKLKGGM